MSRSMLEKIQIIEKMFAIDNQKKTLKKIDADLDFRHFIENHRDNRKSRSFRTKLKAKI